MSAFGEAIGKFMVEFGALWRQARGARLLTWSRILQVFSNLLLFAQFPENTGSGVVDPESVRRLATSLAVCVCLLGLLSAFRFSRYGLAREKHGEILQSLAQRRQAEA